MRNSKIIHDHKPDCKAKKWVEQGAAPFEWNVVKLGRIIAKYNDDLNEVADPQNQKTAFVYIITCADDDCPAEKIINAKSLAII